MFKRLGFVLICLTVINTSYAKKNIPVEFFNHLPMIQQPTISPDGKTIAVIYNQGNETQVAIVPFDNLSDFNVLIKLGAEKYRLEKIDWVNNEKLVVTVTQPFNINSHKLRIPHLYSVGIDGKYMELKSNDYKKARSNSDSYWASSLVKSLLQEDPNHILVESNDGRDGGYKSIFKVNINTGEYEKYLPNTKKISKWFLNKKGHILTAIGSTGNDSDEKYVYVRDTKDSKWEKIKTIEGFKTETFWPLIYDNEKHILYVMTNYKLRKQAIWSYDTKKKEYIKVIAQAPGKMDITSGVYSHNSKEYELIGYEYYDDFEHTVYFDEKDNSLNHQIKNLFAKQGLNAYIFDSDHKDTKFLIAVNSDSKPKRYVIFDAVKMKFIPWFSQFPELSKHELAPVEPIAFKARDGMDLHGYYTVKKGVKNPPLILFPHGGPYARDYQGFNPFVQLFASRGYAVLQVNYRGSTGYGTDYETAGYHEWGRKMQTDLMDGFNWVKENKQADVNNSCIVGASYGGYAALVAGFQTPNKFKCIASISGISNLQKQISHWRVRGSDAYIENAIDSGKGVDDISPINYVDDFKVPVLLIHGDADAVVDVTHSQRMHKKLKKAGKKSKLVTFKYGTHYLDDAANLKVAMKEIDVFLKKHLK